MFCQYFFMRKIIPVFLLFILSNAFLHAQKPNKKVSFSPKPGWVKETDYPKPAKVADAQISGGSYPLLLNRQYNLEEETFYGKFSNKIVNEQGLQEGSSVSISFDPSFQKVKLHSIKVVREGEEIDKLKKEDVQVIQRENSAESFIYDGRLTVLINLKDIRIGDIVEYDFSVSGRNPAYKNYFFTEFYWQYNIPVEKMYCRIICRKDRKLNIRNIGETAALHKADFQGKDEYVWVKEKASALSFDSDTPSWYDPTPATLVSEFSEWQEVVNLVLEHYDVNNSLGKKQQEELHKNLFHSFDTKESKIKKLLSFVQDEVRYLGLENGISAYKPHNPKEVLQQKFGDCKDKSLLLCHLLEGIGVKAYPALVNTRTRSGIEKFLPSPGVFDHCVVMVEVNDTTIWYDPTISGQGGTFDNTTFPHYEKALVIRKDQNKLVDIPKYSIDERSVVEYFQVKFDEEDSRLSIISSFKGYEADYQRSIFKGMNIEEVEKNFLNYYASLYPEIKKRRPIKVRDELRKFETEENYSIKSIWVKNEENKDKLTVDFYPQYISEHLHKPEGKIRSMPLRLNYPLKIQEKIVVDIPGGWPVEAGEAVVQNDYFRFSSKTVPEVFGFTLIYQFELLKDHVPASEVKTYIKDLDKAYNLLGYQIFHYDRSGTAPRLSIPLVILSLIAFSLFVYLAQKLFYSYNPPPMAEQEYYSISGWLLLPMLGLLISPMFIATGLISWDYFNAETIHTLFVPDSPFYNPIIGVFIVLEVIYNILLMVAAGFLLTLMFNRRTSFPPFMKLYFAIQVGFLVLELLIFHPLNLLSANDLGDLYGQAARAIVAAAIWIPYFTISERVKGTFTHRLPGKNGFEERETEETQEELIRS